MAIKKEDNIELDGMSFMTRIACAAAFIIFSFSFLYKLEGTVLFLAQHIYSGGRTQYSIMVGAVIITFALMLLQFVVQMLCRFGRRTHALSYVPSCLALALISDCAPVSSATMSMTAWSVISIVILVLFTVYAVIARKVKVEPLRVSLVNILTCNTLILAVCFVLIGLSANTNDLLNSEQRTAAFIRRCQYDEALEVGKKSLLTSRHLNALRAYALSRKGELGNRLFDYPQTLGSEGLLVHRSDSATLLTLPDSDFIKIGAFPRHGMNVKTYLATVVNNPRQYREAAKDYYLCALLLDKEIDKFASEITRFYTVNDSLPRHYREALLLYSHLRTNAVVTYTSSVMEANYSDFEALEKQYTIDVERRNFTRREFGNTYWWYYFYQ